MRIFTLIMFFAVVLNLVPAAGQSNIGAYNASSYYFAGDTTEHHSNLKIINIGTASIDIKVARDDAGLAVGHTAYFCWGPTCYPPTTFVSPAPVTIMPGDTNGTFVAYLDPHVSGDAHGHTGLSIINYCFYNVADASDSIWVSFSYDIATGIREMSNRPSISTAYPNPADNLTSLSYNLNSAKDVRLIIYNMLGSVIKEIRLSDRQSTLILSTSELKSGIYFYSLVSEGKPLASKKLVVSHR